MNKFGIHSKAVPLTWSKVGTPLAAGSPRFPNSTAAADLFGDVSEDGKGAGWRTLTRTQNPEALTLLFWYHSVGCRRHTERQQSEYKEQKSSSSLFGNPLRWGQSSTCTPSDMLLDLSGPARQTQCSMLWHHSHSFSTSRMKISSIL